MRLLREFRIHEDAVGVPKKIEICFPFLFTSSCWTIPGYANLSSVAWSLLPVHDAVDAWSLRTGSVLLFSGGPVWVEWRK